MMEMAHHCESPFFIKAEPTMPELVLSAAQESQADMAFGKIEATFGTHPDFSANAQPIRDAIRAIIANPKALLPVASFILPLISPLLPPPWSTIVAGLASFLHVSGQTTTAQTNTGTGGVNVLV